MKRLWPLAAGSILLGGCAPALREPPSVVELAGETRHAAGDVDRLLTEARQLYEELSLESVRQASSSWLAAAAADPARIEGLYGNARANVWLAGHEPVAADREAAALTAVQSAQLCTRKAPEAPVCSFWLALALGVQARERRSTAHDALPRMVELLEQVVVERPTLEHAGPHRVLALVLLRAPGWPTGPGDPDLGLEHARQAVAREPGYPPNQLCLAEALAAVGEGLASRQALERGAVLAEEWLDAADRQAREWLEEIAAARSGGWAN